eukprot:TRINITY_DN14320_c0_g1_i6.p3 TRINITY_DN14320_c0_g1~~TRINITY_DN14320_c0_g1_i6.p3  ORF type:complete len:190 (+),score=-13.71 TRINITY_DN14320_c0_g1_i6:522-1091(+)
MSHIRQHFFNNQQGRKYLISKTIKNEFSNLFINNSYSKGKKQINTSQTSQIVNKFQEGLASACLILICNIQLTTQFILMVCKPIHSIRNKNVPDIQYQSVCQKTANLALRQNHRLTTQKTLMVLMILLNAHHICFFNNTSLIQLLYLTPIDFPLKYCKTDYDLYDSVQRIYCIKAIQVILTFAAVQFSC